MCVCVCACVCVCLITNLREEIVVRPKNTAERLVGFLWKRTFKLQACGHHIKAACSGADRWHAVPLPAHCFSLDLSILSVDLSN